MPLSQGTVFGLGILVGGFLITMGALLGYRIGLRNGRKKALESDDGIDLLRIVETLSQWTSDYSGRVSNFHNEIDAASKAMHDSIEPNDVASPIIEVLDSIMDSNQSLRRRLDDAEQQLERQTRDIESYLAEARTDALTSLPNRRAFDQMLDEYFAAWCRGGPRFVIAMVDVDHFKQINDRFGHPEGDVVLRHVATVLRDNLESAIIVARFGGEEFAILMPAPMRVAADRIDRVRKRLITDQVMVGEKMLHVSISAGLAESMHDKMVGPIVRRADEALYAAKGMGRDRVYFHDGSQPVLVGTPEVAMTDPTE